MATFNQVGSGAVFVPRNAQEAVDQAIIDSFLEKATSLGMQPKPLVLHALGDGLLGFLHAAGTYRVSWQKEVRITIPGILSFTLSMPRQGVFTKYQADKVLMSVQAEGFRRPLSGLWEIEETAVLAEEVDPILAVKVAGRWFEVYRWLKRPYVLNDEEARHIATLL
mgnify:CR=1 FL=1